MLADKVRRLQRLGFDQFAESLPQRMDGMNAAAPHVLQDRRNRNVVRADDDIDAERIDKRFVGY